VNRKTKGAVGIYRLDLAESQEGSYGQNGKKRRGDNIRIESVGDRLMQSYHQHTQKRVRGRGASVHWDSTGEW